jgi:hypothetical protein
MTLPIKGFAALAMTLGVAAGAVAQTPAPAAPPAAAPMPAMAGMPAMIPSAPGALSVETTSIGDLLADAGGKAVLEKDMPKLITYPGLDQIKDMTLRAISVYPEAELDDTKLAAIQKDLDAAKK